MSTEDLMSPDASPGQAPGKSGVRRVNNLPLYIVGALMCGFLVVMVLVAMDRAAQQTPSSKKDEKSSSTSMFANEIAGNHKDGIIQPERAAPPQVPAVSSPGIIDIARPENLDAPPRPPVASNLENRGSMEELRRIRMAKMQQFEDAVKAKTGVRGIAARSAESSGLTPGGLIDNAAPATREEALARLAAVRQQIDAQTREDPTAAYKARLQQLQAGGAGSAGGSGSAPRLLPTAGASSPGSKDYSQFAGSGQEDRWKLGAQPEAPRSPYELRAGFVVPATLISGINAELPGQIMAQVSQDVFDTATGKFKLIPQGSRLVGRYASDVAYAQSRILVAWQRIVFPDGKAMDIGSMPGADSAGYAGFNDQVNNHYFRLFASAFLMSGVTAGITLSQNQDPQNNNGNRQTASSALSEALGQQLGLVTAQLISKNMNIAPTLEIRPGYRFNVIVTKDMTFSKPYMPFDY
ncbi:MAG: IncP-type conjugative transfer protein TrbI [Polaromonas sp.]|nr:IncP-type conjugative transfer protein TrbI [Polaromonas sp.]